MEEQKQQNQPDSGLGGTGEALACGGWGSPQGAGPQGEWAGLVEFTYMVVEFLNFKFNISFPK